MKKTNDEINRVIHERIIGKCWHEWKENGKETIWFGREASVIRKFLCGCGEKYSGLQPPNPDYTSSDSPRRYLEEAVAKVASPNSYAQFEDTLLEVIQRDHPPREWRQYNNSYLTYLFINATAEQIARALVSCLEEGGTE